MTLITGCTVHPQGESPERQAALKAGKSFENIPPLPENPTADDLVDYAMHASGELEQLYWQWRAAIEQIPQDGTQATNLNISLGAAISRGRTARDMTTVGLSNDAMTDIQAPTKLDAAARRALEMARASGQRFRKTQFALRNKVLSAYYDYALTAELIRLEQSNQQTLQATASLSESANRAGTAGRQDVLKARNEADLSKNELANMQSQLPAQLAAINALLNRAPDASIPAPDHLPTATQVTLDDAQFLSLVAKRNPELDALAAEIRSNKDGVRLAQLQYFPDFNLSVGTDLAGITQTVLGQTTVPFLRYEALNAAIAQSQANLRATEAMRRQTGSDLGAQVIMDITTLRDADRQLDLFEQTILPRSRQVVDLSRSAYEAGRTNFLELLDAQRSLISLQRVVASLRIVRAKRLADLESVAAMPLGVPGQN